MRGGGWQVRGWQVGRLCSRERVQRCAPSESRPPTIATTRTPHTPPPHTPPAPEGVAPQLREPAVGAHPLHQRLLQRVGALVTLQGEVLASLATQQGGGVNRCLLNWVRGGAVGRASAATSRARHRQLLPGWLPATAWLASSYCLAPSHCLAGPPPASQPAPSRPSPNDTAGCSSAKHIRLAAADAAYETQCPPAQPALCVSRTHLPVGTQQPVDQRHRGLLSQRQAVRPKVLHIALLRGQQEEQGGAAGAQAGGAPHAVHVPAGGKEGGQAGGQRL